MIDRRKRSGEKLAYGVALPRRALLIRAIELLLSAFYKKTHPLPYMNRRKRVFELFVFAKIFNHKVRKLRGQVINDYANYVFLRIFRQPD